MYVLITKDEARTLSSVLLGSLVAVKRQGAEQIAFQIIEGPGGFGEEFLLQPDFEKKIALVFDNGRKPLRLEMERTGG